eukprot:2056589-Alexandrium_andersonii.AAC.1
MPLLSRQWATLHRVAAAGHAMQITLESVLLAGGRVRGGRLLARCLGHCAGRARRRPRRCRGLTAA